MAKLTPKNAGKFPNPQKISVPTKEGEFKYNQRITFGEGNEGGSAEFVKGLAEVNRNTAWTIGNNILSGRNIETDEIGDIGKDAEGKWRKNKLNTRYSLEGSDGDVSLKHVDGIVEDAKENAWDTAGNNILSLRTTKRS